MLSVCYLRIELSSDSQCYLDSYQNSYFSRECAVPDSGANPAGDDGSPTSAGLKLQDNRIVRESTVCDSEGVAASAGEQADLAHGESAPAASELLRGLPAAGMSPESLVARLGLQRARQVDMRAASAAAALVPACPLGRWAWLGVGGGGSAAGGM